MYVYVLKHVEKCSIDKPHAIITHLSFMNLSPVNEQIHLMTLRLVKSLITKREFDL